jgi:CO/xanthine dehydrogenase Mo-binding subunit
MEVNTETNPEHWKTAASRSLFMAGRAVLAAAEDAIKQLRRTASIVLRCSPEELEVGGGMVFLKNNPNIGIGIEKIAHGYRYPNGNSIGGQVIGRGSYIFKHLTELNPDTGEGNPGPQWTVGAQAVEVEFDIKNYTYKIVKAVSVIDAGKVINTEAARGQIMGGMCLGLSFASREAFAFSGTGIILNPQLRTYHIMRLGENPEYIVDFVETPDIEGPYGLRGLGEMGVIAMPAALANSLSLAAGAALNQLPLTPEFIWKTKKEDQSDPF